MPSTVGKPRDKNNGRLGGVSNGDGDLGVNRQGARDAKALASGLRSAPPVGKGSVDINYHFMTGTTCGGQVTVQLTIEP
jgi:hypothetical protein